ncbi:hypothetical protein FQN50_000278 [Emmonsiellopsis sp. PD_5]|nr:hypothetical protein FQN50_000278 [Emmonsiellopsis sp. PD_5]
MECINDLIDSYTFHTVNADIPNMNPVYKTLLGNRQKLDEISTQLPLNFPEHLEDILGAGNPPSKEFFLTLPTLDDVAEKNKIRGIYAILFEKDGAMSKVYRGSGTCAKQGLHSRFRCYDDNTSSSNVPQLVQGALADGYKITAHRVLCWCVIPDVKLIPIARYKMIGVEAVFAYILFAFRLKPDENHQWTTWWPWSWNEVVGWKPLCSHTAVREKPRGNWEMTPEELTNYEASAKDRSYNYMTTRDIGARYAMRHLQERHISQTIAIRSQGI